jgi:hypothetical protein
VASEALQDSANQVVAVTTGANILNPAEGVAEAEEKMAGSLSELEYVTIKGLQSVLRTMMDTYNKDCPEWRLIKDVIFWSFVFIRRPCGSGWGEECPYKGGAVG